MNHEIKIGDFTVTITGIKHDYRTNLTDTDKLLGELLNHISLMATDAAYYNDEHGYPATADVYEIESKDCYEFCKELGMYK